MAEETLNGLVRRMVNLPRTVLREFSRAVDQGIDRLRIGGSRRVPTAHHRPFYFSNGVGGGGEEWDFLARYEGQYGTMHPFFYACRLADTLRMAGEERRFVFVYLHAPDHPFTGRFCRETLGSDLVVQFLDANLVCWGAMGDRGEGLRLATSLRLGSFPFCAVLAPTSGDGLVVLQQIEGPVSPTEMVEIIQRTMEEQGMALGSRSLKEEERRRADWRLRDEQDAAYLVSLQVDREKGKQCNNSASKEKARDRVEASMETGDRKLKEKSDRAKEAAAGGETRPVDRAVDPSQATKILIRFPNGERREKSFSSTEKVGAIYGYVDSLGVQGVEGSYRLMSSFPRKVYGVDQMGTTLKDAGLHPRATLFLKLA